MAVLLAVLSAVVTATSNVLERSAAQQSAPELSMRPVLLLELARRPRWLAGVALLLVAFGLQAAALHAGALSLVQPLIVLELPLTVAGSAVLLRAPLRRQDVVAVAGVVAGVVALLWGLAPRPAAGAPGSAVLVLVAGGGAAAVAALVGLALRVAGDPRAALLGAAGGVAAGVTAVFVKRASERFADGGVPAVAGDGWTYAMALAGLLALYLAQNAYHAGSLVASQPGLTAADPVTGLLVGTLLLGEPVQHSPARLALAVLGGVVLLSAVVLLARAPALLADGAADGGPGFGAGVGAGRWAGAGISRPQPTPSSPGPPRSHPPGSG